MPLSIAGLSFEAQIAVMRFGRAASRYYDQRYKITEFIPNIGPVERVAPDSVEIEYFKSKDQLLKCTDPELKTWLDQIDTTKLLDALEDESSKIHTAAYKNMVRIEKILIDLAKV